MDGSHLQSRQPTPKGVFAKRKTFTTPNVFDALGLRSLGAAKSEDAEPEVGRVPVPIRGAEHPRIVVEP